MIRLIAKAAERLRMAQPPLSVQIRKLEAEIGTPLFRRGTRGMDLTGLEPIAKCPNPKCGARVFENAMSYFCENAVSAAPTCGFRTGKIVLSREMEREQVMKLIQNGRTDLLHKFISKKGRPFSAFLVVGENGKVGFEFAPREPKGKGKAKAVVAPKVEAPAKEG